MYDMTSAMFMAARTMLQFARGESRRHSPATEILQWDFYVEYLITGAYRLELHYSCASNRGGRDALGVHVRNIYRCCLA